MSNTTTVAPATSYFASVLPQMRLVNQQMLYWVPLVVLIPGLVFNIFMAGVFMRARFWRNTTMGFYYTMHAVFSSICLVVGIVVFLLTSQGISYTQDLVSCNFVWSLRVGSLVGVQYFMVLMTIDRTINTLYPRRFVWLSKPRNLMKLTALVYTVTLIYSFSTQSLRTMFYKYQTINNRTVLVSSVCNYLTLPLGASINVSFFVVRVVGFIVIQVANIVIIRKLLASKRNLRRTATTSGNSQTAGTRKGYISNKEFYFGLSLMSCNLIQIVFVVPSLVVLMIQLIYAFDPNPPASMASYYVALYSITSFGNYMFEAIIFWINLATNKIFRAELVGIFYKGQAPLMTTRNESTMPNQLVQ